MAEIVLEGDEPTPLAQMLAALVEANVAADPAKERIIETTRGAIDLIASDAQLTVGLKFTPGALVVTSGPVPGADLRIRADSTTLLALSNVPLRFGLPDTLTAEGRAVTIKFLTGKLRLQGLLPMLPRNVGLLRKVTRLLSVA